MIASIKHRLSTYINRLFASVNKKSKIDSKAKIYRFAKIIDSQIDKYTYIGINTKVINCQIGKFCSIASNVYIGLEAHTLNNISTSPIFTESYNATGTKWIEESTFNPVQTTYIGNDVWIGYNALIKGGVSIGDGAIIGAGAIVTKDVPPYAIVGGIPAKILKYRFSENIISQLLSLKWWNMEEDIIKKKIRLFQKENPTLNDIFSLL